MSAGDEAQDAAKFVARQNTLTATFPTSEEATAALAVLRGAGIDSEHVRVAALDSHTREVARRQEESEPTDDFKELVHAFGETFSDDDEFYAEISQALLGGWSAVQVDLSGREEQRQSLAELLRANGARAIYYWGALASERL